MILGEFNAEWEATIPLKVTGGNGLGREIVAMIDTGFNGYLTLPQSMIAELGCPYVMSGIVTVGDGRVEDLDIYAATLIWDGETRTVEVDAAETIPLVGMALIHGYDLYIRALSGGPVKVEKVLSGGGKEIA